MNDPAEVPFYEVPFYEEVSVREEDPVCEEEEVVYEEDVVCEGVLKIKWRLEGLLGHSQTAKNNDLRDIMKSVKSFLKKHCKHHFIRDYVDITPDRGMTVIYCDICESCWDPTAVNSNVS